MKIDDVKKKVDKRKVIKYIPYNTVVRVMHNTVHHVLVVHPYGKYYRKQLYMARLVLPLLQPAVNE